MKTAFSLAKVEGGEGGGAEFEQTSPQKFKCPGGWWRGGGIEALECSTHDRRSFDDDNNNNNYNNNNNHNYCSTWIESVLLTLRLSDLE